MRLEKRETRASVTFFFTGGWHRACVGRGRKVLSVDVLVSVTEKTVSSVLTLRVMGRSEKPREPTRAATNYQGNRGEKKKKDGGSLAYQP